MRNICYWGLIFSCFMLRAGQQAVVVVPVADLLSEPVRLSTQVDVERAYQAVPIACHHCQRAGQLLFNERVTIVSQSDYQACVSVDHLYDSHGPRNYWMLRKNLMTVERLNAHGIDTDLICPDDWHNTLTLKLPVADLVIHRTYSAGTRFVLSAQQASNDAYTVDVLDAHAMQLRSIDIPKRVCILHSIQSHGQRVRAYVQLLRSWIEFSAAGVIPYVCRGMSLTHVCSGDTLDWDKTVKRMHEPNVISTCPECRRGAFSGFDCSYLILRAAQICGIPYWLRNTATMEQLLQPLADDEQLHEGDAIWFDGHVIIISDVARALAIEARGYAAGFGRVHEVSLERLFVGIQTYDDLMHAYKNKRELILLNSRGKVRFVIDRFKILKFASVWQKIV